MLIARRSGRDDAELAKGREEEKSTAIPLFLKAQRASTSVWLQISTIPLFPRKMSPHEPFLVEIPGGGSSSNSPHQSPALTLGRLHPAMWVPGAVHSTGLLCGKG